MSRVHHENSLVYGTRIVRALGIRTTQAMVKALGRVQRDADFRAMLIELYEGFIGGDCDQEVLQEWLVDYLEMNRELVF